MVHSDAHRPGHRFRWVVAAGVSGAAVGMMTVPVVGAAAAPRAASAATRYAQTNLIADLPGMASVTDPNLVNPWGLSAGTSSPLWVSDNGTDVSTLYTGAGTAGTVTTIPLVVSIPGGAPTGQVFNPTTGFVLPNGAPALFLFASENGVLSGWNQAAGTSAVQVGATGHAVYKGLALEQVAGTQRLLAANFHSGRIDVFTSTFHRVHVGAHQFVDPSLPVGYAPFNVAVIDDMVLVAYAKRDAAGRDDIAGAGHGFVDAYTLNGRLLGSIARRGPLDSPWAMAVAPAGFGQYAGDLLVGNFGDGRIHAYDLTTGLLKGTLLGANGQPLEIEGLWGLLPGNGVNAPANAVWFSAGPGDEAHGLVGLLSTS